MATVIELDPWAGRLPPGYFALHGQLGVCRVLAARGLWRTVEALDFEPAEGVAVAVDPLAGERGRPVEREVPVYALRALDPLRDLMPRRCELVELLREAKR